MDVGLNVEFDGKRSSCSGWPCDTRLIARTQTARTGVVHPVLTPAFLAASDFANTIPWRSSIAPHTATAFPRSAGFIMIFTLA